MVSRNDALRIAVLDAYPDVYADEEIATIHAWCVPASEYEDNGRDGWWVSMDCVVEGQPWDMYSLIVDGDGTIGRGDYEDDRNLAEYVPYPGDDQVAVFVFRSDGKIVSERFPDVVEY